MPAAPPPDLDRVLGAVAAFGLPSANGRLPPVPLAGAAWDRLLLAARQQRLTSLLSRAVATGGLAATAEQAAAAAEAERADSLRVLSIEMLLLEVVDLLGAASIPYRVLKGPSIAHLDYPEPELRGYIDVDVLVPGGRVDEATAALVGAGHTRSIPEVSPGFDRRFGKSVTFVSPLGVEIDLHRTFDRGPFGINVRLADLWATSADLPLAGRSLTCLAPEERFLNVCFHAALGNTPPRLVPLRDVAQIASNGRLDLDRVHSLSRSWRSDAVVAQAVTLAWERLGLTEPTQLSAWASTYEQTAWDTRTLALYVDGSHTHATRTLAILRSLPGLRAKTGYARAVVLPSRAYCEAVDQAPLTRLRRLNRPWRYLQGEEAASAGDPGAR